MVSVAYSEAAVEVLDILKHTRREEVEKIPETFLNFLKENSSKTYVSKLDHTKSIKDMNLNTKTEAILGLIYMKYWASDDAKKSFIQKLNNNQIRVEQDKEEKRIGSDNLFKENSENHTIDYIDNNDKTMLPNIVLKENIFQKIINKLISNHKINPQKINIIFNKINKYSINRKIAKNIFKEFKIIGNIKLNNYCDFLLNEKNNYKNENKKLKRQYLKIIKNIKK